MRLLALILAALGALVTLALALRQPSTPPSGRAQQAGCEAELRACRAQGQWAAERVLRCLADGPAD